MNEFGGVIVSSSKKNLQRPTKCGIDIKEVK